MTEKLEFFKDREELKWRFHAELCKGDHTAEAKMNHAVNEKLYKTVKDVNEWLRKIKSPYRVRET